MRLLLASVRECKQMENSSLICADGRFCQYPSSKKVIKPFSQNAAAPCCSFQGIHVGAGYAGWHQLGRGFRCAHGNRCDSWFHQTHPVAIKNTQNFRHLTNSPLKILVSKLLISTGEVLRYANAVLPHSACVIFLSLRAVVQCEDSDLRSPKDLPCTSPSLCCLYNAGSRTPSCIFDFVCEAVRLGFSFTKANFPSLSPASGPQCNHRPGGPDGCRTVVM